MRCTSCASNAANEWGGCSVAKGGRPLFSEQQRFMLFLIAPPLLLIGIMTFDLITSSGTMALAVNFGYRRDRELSPHEQFFMVLLSPRTPLEIKRKLRTWEGRVLDGEITPQESQDLRFMYQSFVVG